VVKIVKAEEYLKEIRTLDILIEENFEELEKLDALSKKVTSTLSDAKVQSSSAEQSRVEACAIKIACLKDDILKDINRMLDLKKEAHNLIIKSCSPKCMQLLFKRYFEFKNWETIAIEMGFTYQYVSDKLHKRALNQLQKNLEKNERVDRS